MSSIPVVAFCKDVIRQLDNWSDMIKKNRLVVFGPMQSVNMALFHSGSLKNGWESLFASNRMSSIPVVAFCQDVIRQLYNWSDII